MTTALLVADAQVGITSTFPFCQPAMPALTAAVDGAREAGIEIVFAVAGLRSSGRDLSPRNAVMGQFFAMSEVFHEPGPGPVVDPRLGPGPDEPVLTKRRVSAFHGSELEMVLRSRGVTDLAIAGFATSAVVLATAIDAIDHDYRVTVLADCCADPDPEVHDFLLDRVLPGRGVVVRTAPDWLGDARS